MTEKQIIAKVGERLNREAKDRLAARLEVKRKARGYRLKRALLALAKCPENAQMHL